MYQVSKDSYYRPHKPHNITLHTNMHARTQTFFGYSAQVADRQGFGHGGTLLQLMYCVFSVAATFSFLRDFSGVSIRLDSHLSLLKLHSLRGRDRDAGVNTCDSNIKKLLSKSRCKKSLLLSPGQTGHCSITSAFMEYWGQA